MAADPTKVQVGYKGQVVVGAPGVTFPTNPHTAWDAEDFFDLGLVSDDGVTIGASQDVQEFFAWGRPIAPVRTQVTSEEFTVQLSLIETNPYALSLYFGVPLSGFTSTAASSPVPQFLAFTKGLASSPDIRAVGLDVIDGNKLFRYQFPRAQVTDRGDLTFKSDELISYQITFRALLSSDDVAMKVMVSDLALPA